MRTASSEFSRRGVLSAGASLAISGTGADRAGSSTAELMFDSHSHLVSPDIARYPPLPTASAQAAGNLPDIGFRQFGTARPIADARAMTGWMRAAGVDGLAAIQKRGTYGLDNRYILDSAARYPNIFFPVIILDAQDDATPVEVTALALHGLAGVRLTGVMAPDGSFPWLASEKADRLWAVAAKTGMVIDIMTNPFGHPIQAIPVYADLARRFPAVRIVIDHLNWPDARGAPDFGLDAAILGLSRHPNIFFKFTTMNMDKLQDAGLSPAAFLAHAVDVLGVSRLVWGSDMGNTPGTYAELVARAHASAVRLPAEARRAVFRDNGRALFTRRYRQG